MSGRENNGIKRLFQIENQQLYLILLPNYILLEDAYIDIVSKTIIASNTFEIRNYLYQMYVPSALHIGQIIEKFV